LRVADAAHIDHRRAPRFLRALTSPNQNSDVHWKSQSKLGKLSIDKNFLVYTGGPFDVEDAEAWWLAFDMISAIDDELRAVHGILDEKEIVPFVATAVKGAKSPEAIAQRITTKRWKPVSTELRVSDVPGLVRLLGGERLYGSDPSAPLRELVQNATDAVRAKRALLGDIAGETGKVRVRLRRTHDIDWLDFEDDGIGMSHSVLTGALLDFGRSFWQSSAMRKEFPGLLSKGVKTTGKFGIGFFSVFMLGDRVTVTSRRYDAGMAETQTLDFQKGLRVRPILREPNETEMVQEPGTRVSVALRIKHDEPGGLLHRGSSGGNTQLASLRETIARVSPSLDVSVEVDENGKKETAVFANDWLTESPESLIGRSRTEGWMPDSINRTFGHLRVLTDPTTGEIHGRACLCLGPSYSVSPGVVTVGGFRACPVDCVGGVLLGEAATVARNTATPTATGSALREWAAEQARLISASKLDGDGKLVAASLVMLCGGDASDLPIAILNGEYLTGKELEHRLSACLDEIQVYEGEVIEYDEDDYVVQRHFKDAFSASETLFFVPKKHPSLLRIGNQEWPSCIPGLYLPERPKCCEDAFHLALKAAWKTDPQWEEEKRTVGNVDGQEIEREVRIYSRPIDLSFFESLNDTAQEP
jgi:hypothetical protein